MRFIKKIAVIMHNFLANHAFCYHILPKTSISNNATIHKTAFIDTYVRISDNCVIHPNAVVLRGTILEEGVSIGSGCIIGGEGFQGFKTDKKIISMIHTGGVIIKKGAEIQSRSCVDKGRFSDSTIIGEDTIIGPQVHIAHGAIIGNKCNIGASAMIAGYTHIEDNVFVGSNASLSDAIHIGNSARIFPSAVVTRDVPNDASLSGNFAIDHRKHANFFSTLQK